MAQYATRDDIKEVVNSALETHDLKLFKYLDKRFDTVEADIAKLDEKYDWLLKTLDKFLKRLDDFEANELGRDAQLARHDRWLHQLADKTGLELKT